MILTIRPVPFPHLHPLGSFPEITRMMLSPRRRTLLASASFSMLSLLAMACGSSDESGGSEIPDFVGNPPVTPGVPAGPGVTPAPNDPAAPAPNPPADGSGNEGQG